MGGFFIFGYDDGFKNNRVCDCLAHRDVDIEQIQK